MTERKVLLIDDERDFLEALGERMRNRGLDISMAASAEEAIRKAKKEGYNAKNNSQRTDGSP